MLTIIFNDCSFVFHLLLSTFNKFIISDIVSFSFWFLLDSFYYFFSLWDSWSLCSLLPLLPLKPLTIFIVAALTFLLLIPRSGASNAWFLAIEFSLDSGRLPLISSRAWNVSSFFRSLLGSWGGCVCGYFSNKKKFLSLKETQARVIRNPALKFFPCFQ